MNIAFNALSALVLVMATSSQSAHAQVQVLSNGRLLDSARSATNQGLWVQAYAFLLAYVQRDPPEMAEADFRRKITEALEASYYNASMRRSGNGGGSAGLDARGDQLGSWGGGSARNVDVPRASGTPRSYPLRCQGGGGMHLVYGQSGGRAEVTVSFGRAPTAATESYPGDGRCAWLDRPVGGSEPTKMLWRIPAQDTRLVNLTIGDADWAAAKGLPRPKGGHAALIGSISGSGVEGLIKAVVGGGLFQVQCYNNGKGSCVVTKFDWVR